MIVSVLVCCVADLAFSPQGEQGYWRFEEGQPNTVASGTGSVLDTSGQGQHGTPVGMPFYRPAVPTGIIPATAAANALCMEFDAGDDAIAIQGDTFPFHQQGDCTLEFWLRFAPMSHQSVFWTRLDTTDTNRFNIFVNANGTFGFDYRSPSGFQHLLIGGTGIGVQLPSLQWVHIAIARAGDVYNLYVDGVFAANVQDVNPDLPTAVGWQMSGRTTNPFLGQLDEVRLSTGALTPDDFLLSYGITLNVANLVAGQMATTQVTRSAQGNNIVVGFSFAGDGPTPTQWGLAQLSPPVMQSPLLHANASGSATFMARVPASAAGRTVWIQALDLTDSVFSNGLQEVIL